MGTVNLALIVSALFHFFFEMHLFQDAQNEDGVDQFLKTLYQQ